MESNERDMFIQILEARRQVILVKKYLEDFPGTYICLSDLHQQLRQMVLQQIQNFCLLPLSFYNDPCG